MFTRGETETANVHFEIVSVAFQLAAVHSRIAAEANLKTDEGVKDAIASCKTAAGLFVGLQAYVEANFSSSPSPDFDKGVLQFLAMLMQAQALECALAKVRYVARVIPTILSYLSLSLPLSLPLSLSLTLTHTHTHTHTQSLYRSLSIVLTHTLALAVHCCVGVP